MNISAIKSRIDLVEYIGRTVPLKKVGRQWRGVCPFHAERTPSLYVHPEKQVFHCFGCGAGGDVVSFVQRLERVECAEAAQRLAREAGLEGLPAPPRPRKQLPPPTDPFAAVAQLAPVAETPHQAETRHDWQARLAGAIPIPDTPGEAYLAGRGIDGFFAATSLLHYHPRWCGVGPAVLFPIVDQYDRLVGMHGRFPAPPPGMPKGMTCGQASRGIFTTPGGLLQDDVIVTEGPVDALTLVQSGFPAIALMGTHYPEWLPPLCAGRRVVLATDADLAGDTAAAKLCADLLRQGAAPHRLRPPDGKDWNEYLQRHGEDATTDTLREMLDGWGVREWERR